MRRSLVDISMGEWVTFSRAPIDQISRNYSISATSLGTVISFSWQFYTIYCMTIAKLIVGSLSCLLLAIPASGTNQQPHHPREYSQTQEGRSIWIQRFGLESEAIPQMLRPYNKFLTWQTRHSATVTQSEISKTVLSKAAQKLPKLLETAVVSDLNSRVGLPLRISSSNITKSQPATWQECLPTSGASGISANCQPVRKSGWQVAIEYDNQTWIYYANQNGTVILDGPGSINNTIKAAIAKRLAIPVKDIKITAAQLLNILPACPENTLCQAPFGPQFSWRVLVENGEMFHVDMGGNDWQRGLQARKSQAGLPLTLHNAVLRDMADRYGLTANFQVEGIKAITWNWCQGGGDKPTPPEMGICPNIEESGWQMVVKSGPIRYVYYLQEGTDPNRVAPDGSQSIPQSAIDLARREAARRAKTTTANIRIQQVKPQFFDRCLSVNNQGLDCRQEIQAGWLVMAVGGQSMSSAWFYHVDLLGNQAKFVRAGQWFPVPSAPPPQSQASPIVVGDAMNVTRDQTFNGNGTFAFRGQSISLTKLKYLELGENQRKLIFTLSDGRKFEIKGKVVEKTGEGIVRSVMEVEMGGFARGNSQDADISGRVTFNQMGGDILGVGGAITFDSQPIQINFVSAGSNAR